LREGNIDVLSVHQVRIALLQKRMDLVKLKQQLMENWIALELAAGQYIARGDQTATTREGGQ